MASLRAIVDALGGDLWDRGQRAVVRAPGHSALDRSVSLKLSGDRLIIHSFGAADWREVRAHLVELGLIDPRGVVTNSGGGGSGRAPARPDPLARVRTARLLWDDACELTAGSASMRHLFALVGSAAAEPSRALRHHPAAPVSVFRAGSRRLPALVARISDADDGLTAVEIAYLRPDGRRADSLRLPRKTVGSIPAGAAVRLFPAASDLLVGEGIMTVLSATARFRLPGWALLSARNLAVWTPPAGVQRVLIAADRGPAGEQAAARLSGHLRASGFVVRVAFPPPPYEDWNEAAAPSRKREEGG